MSIDPEAQVSARHSRDAGGIFDIPAGLTGFPSFDRGWVEPDGRRLPFLSYVGADPSVNWSADAERLHEEASRTHFIDRWTRAAIIDGLGSLPAAATILDLGCSTGYLLEDINAAHPNSTLIGIDLVAAGLSKAHEAVPNARLLHADACEIPLADQSIDALSSANLLEHIRDDRRALREIARVVRPAGRVALVVPAGPRTYDYYDRFLGHERRYARGELAAKCADAGLVPEADLHIAGLIYPLFWLVKLRNRLLYDDLRGADLERRVAADIARTHNSRAGELAARAERRLQNAGLRVPFGIRSLVVAKRDSRA